MLIKIRGYRNIDDIQRFIVDSDTEKVSQLPSCMVDIYNVTLSIQQEFTKAPSPL